MRDPGRVAAGGGSACTEGRVPRLSDTFADLDIRQAVTEAVQANGGMGAQGEAACTEQGT